MGFVTRRDSGNWVARYRDPNGKACKKTFRLKAEAEAFLVTVEASKLSGNYLPENKVTLAEWWARYENEVPRRATTAARDRVVMGHWWLPALGRRALRSLTPADVRRVVSVMADKPLSPVTVRTHLGVFSAVMTRAVEAELIARSPVRGIRLPDSHRRQPRFLSGDELARLAEEMPVEYRPMVYLAGVLGLRWSEVAGLRVGRVDFLRRSISIVETLAEVEGRLMFAPPKSKASVRTVTAPAELLEVLAAHLSRRGRLGPDDLVFTAPAGGPLRVAAFRQRVWRPAVRRAGLDGFTFHGLRHSSVGFMVALGAHPLVIQRRVGHASVSTTMDVYGAILPEVDATVATGLGRLLGPDGGGELQTPRAQSAPKSGPDLDDAEAT
jgi:integrase